MYAPGFQLLTKQIRLGPVVDSIHRFIYPEMSPTIIEASLLALTKIFAPTTVSVEEVITPEHHAYAAAIVMFVQGKLPSAGEKPPSKKEIVFYVHDPAAYDGTPQQLNGVEISLQRQPQINQHMLSGEFNQKSTKASIAIAPGDAIHNKNGTVTGTLGGFVLKNGKRYLMTAAHHLKQMWGGVFCQNNQIAASENFELHEDTDCGIALLNPDVEINSAIQLNGRQLTVVGTSRAKEGDWVFKIGAKTGLTVGVATKATFLEGRPYPVLMIRGFNEPHFCDKGDCGSLVCRFDEPVLLSGKAEVVGLLIAGPDSFFGGRSFAVASDIADVKAALNFDDFVSPDHSPHTSDIYVVPNMNENNSAKSMDDRFIIDEIFQSKEKLMQCHEDIVDVSCVLETEAILRQLTKPQLMYEVREYFLFKVLFPDEFGMVALHFAALNDHYELVGNLLSHGTDVNMRDHSLQTPLHKAAFRRNWFCCDLLLCYGADPECLDMEGRKPADMVKYPPSTLQTGHVPTYSLNTKYLTTKVIYCATKSGATEISYIKTRTPDNEIAIHKHSPCLLSFRLPASQATTQEIVLYDSFHNELQSFTLVNGQEISVVFWVKKEHLNTSATIEEAWKSLDFRGHSFKVLSVLIVPKSVSKWGSYVFAGEKQHYLDDDLGSQTKKGVNFCIKPTQILQPQAIKFKEGFVKIVGTVEQTLGMHVTILDGLEYPSVTVSCTSFPFIENDLQKECFFMQHPELPPKGAYVVQILGSQMGITEANLVGVVSTNISNTNIIVACTANNLKKELGLDDQFYQIPSTQRLNLERIVTEARTKIYTDQSQTLLEEAVRTFVNIYAPLSIHIAPVITEEMKAFASKVLQHTPNLTAPPKLLKKQIVFYVNDPNQFSGAPLIWNGVEIALKKFHPIRPQMDVPPPQPPPSYRHPLETQVTPGCWIYNLAKEQRGTLGGFVKKNGKRYLLTCAHVLQKQKEGGSYQENGTLICHPLHHSLFDGLLGFREIDSAISQIDPMLDIDSRIHFRGQGLDIVGMTETWEGQLVFKVGARTGEQMGVVYDTAADSHSDQYIYNDSLKIQGTRGIFSDSGDSGSLICDYNEALYKQQGTEVVGMVCAGPDIDEMKPGENYFAVGIKIQQVQAAMKFECFINPFHSMDSPRKQYIDNIVQTKKKQRQNFSDIVDISCVDGIGWREPRVLQNPFHQAAWDGDLQQVTVST